MGASWLVCWIPPAMSEESPEEPWQLSDAFGSGAPRGSSSSSRSLHEGEHLPCHGATMDGHGGRPDPELLARRARSPVLRSLIFDGPLSPLLKTQYAALALLPSKRTPTGPPQELGRRGKLGELLTCKFMEPCGGHFK